MPNNIIRKIERLETLLTLEGVEKTVWFEATVNECCFLMQRFHEKTGYSWSTYKEVVR